MALDTSYIANAFSFPELDLQTLLASPTIELVRAFLTVVESKGHDYDQVSAAKLRADVELENNVRSSDSKGKAQKAAATKQAKEIEELKGKLNEAEGTCRTLSSDLEQVRSASSGSVTEVRTLRERIEALEESNRNALGLVESKSVEKDRIAQELAEQHGKLLGFRREISQLEERNQALENVALSQKFKEQSLQQEIDLLKRNNDWHAKELQTRSQEHAKFRKERNARIASLQRELEESSASVDTLKRTESTLRQRLDEVQGKADEAFAKIAGLEEDFSRREQGWKTETDGSKRLAELQAQNAATHRARLQEVQEQLSQIKDDAADEIGRLQAEIETERSDKEHAEGKVADLELKVERLEQQPRLSRPGTPMRNGTSDPATPGRAGSPFAIPGSVRKMEKMTHTQYISRINELQQDLLAEERRTAKLSQAMDEMLATLESRGPELLELRSEQTRLEEEVLSFSRLLDEANETREHNAKDAERWQGEAETRAREGEILRQQLRDLSAQVKILLVEIQSRDQGLETMSGPERFQLEQAARGELENWSQEESLTQQLISQRLVIFRNVDELQKQNLEQLRMLRLFGEQMEGEEARQKAAQSEADAQQVEALTQQIARYKDELSATATQIDSYMKERDMFRRMLRHRGLLDPNADVEAAFGQSVPPATPQRNGLVEAAQTPRSKDIDDMHKLLKEQQNFFDQYRNESSTDRKILKDQVDALGREKSGLQAEVAHWKSQKTLADERLQMLQSNFAALRNENAELQRRTQQLAENAAKQDLRTQQVAEELVEARSMAETLRNESANAKAEKELWKRIEARLTDDNKNLMDERSRLNKLVADLQNLQNERELSDSETRRRLQSRVETLESELAETKKKMEQEIEDARRAALRREYEDGQARTRIDDLVKSLGLVREELIAATTMRDQLQVRLDEIKIDLRSAEEKVAALQPRPTPRAPEAQPNGDAEDELSAEQRLALELSEVRRELELARNEIETGQQQIEQYKSIAQSTEEELQNFNETSEQFKEETDRLISQKDIRAQELQQRVDDLLAELTTTNGELSELRTKHDDSSRVLEEQKANYENELARLRDDTDRHSEEKKLYQADLKAQADIAQQAQQSYEDELLKHAEAARSLHAVRKEYNELRTEVAGVRAEAEAAKTSLINGEESWQAQKEALEREFEEVKRRRADADEQNRRLHAQMETFSSEVAALRAGRSAPTGDDEGRAGTPSSTNIDNMQEVVRYLRREKEIVDVQYELSTQEAKRLQQQLEYSNTQLEDARQKLAEERRQSADKTASEGSTTKLMQTINELNLFRESSTTLRNEARQAREQLEERKKDIDRLASEIQPLKGRLAEVEGELEGSQGEVRLLQEDRDHWRERTQNIISKYDRVDPAELEGIKTQLESLRAEKERLESEQAPLRDQVADIDKKVDAAVEESTKALSQRLDAFRNQAKEQNRKQVQKIRESEAATEAAVAEKTKLEQELEQLKRQLLEAQAHVNEESTRTGQEDGGDEGAAIKLADKEKEVAELSLAVETLQAKVTEFESQVVSLQAQLDTALQGEEGEVQASSALDTETLDKLRQELATAQQEVESLRANAVSSSGPDQSLLTAESAMGERSVADQVAEQVAQLRAEMDQQHTLARQQLEEERDRRIEGMKNSLRNRLKDERDKIRQELIVEHTAEMQKLREEHEAAITALKHAHQAELERLVAEGSVAVTKASEPESTTATETKQESPPESPTEEQMIEMMKTNSRVRGIFNNNVNRRVNDEKQLFQRTLAEKDERIEELQKTIAELEAQGPSTTDGAADHNEALDDLQQKLAQAEEEKQAAVRQATDNASKKAALQANMMGNLQAKLQVVRKAVLDTPEKAVKEVWEVADKAKAPPKPAAPAVAAASSPVSTTPKSAIPPSPLQAAPQPSTNQSDTPDQSEQDKVQQRQARFGTVPAPTLSGTFGQPSTLPPKPAPSTGAFGQPSQRPGSGAFGQRPRRPSMAASSGPPNVTAAVFTPAPATDATTSTADPSTTSLVAPKQNVGTGPQALRGIAASAARAGFGGIPRAGGAAGRGGSQNINIQGAAAAQRGGAAAGSGIPRGGAAAGRGGAGGRGGGGAGVGAGAGQKRALEGSDGGGDGKRMRGGGGGGGGQGDA